METVIIKSDDKIIQAKRKFHEAEKAYLEKFGESSLDRVIFGEPTDYSVKGFTESTKKLRRAIRQGVPLDQVSLQLWKHIVF